MCELNPDEKYERMSNADKAISLLEEIIFNHADPESADYNECDKEGEQCLWCDHAKKWIAKNKS